MLEITKFLKSYGSHTILDIPHLQITNGVHWIKGTNGSGKSTFLKSLAGILDFKGRVILSKQFSLKDNPTQFRSMVNFSEAEPVFPAFLTGLELLNLFVKGNRGSMSQVDSLIYELGLNSYIKKPLQTYSSGMIKKISLISAFVGRPSVILLDEPLITIDSSALQVLYKRITEKHANEGTCFIITSHQPIDKQKLPITSELLVGNQTIICTNECT